MEITRVMWIDGQAFVQADFEDTNEELISQDYAQKLLEEVKNFKW